LLPHLNVAENVVFGLKLRKPPPVEREQRLRTVAEIVGLSELLHRKPAQLPGGRRHAGAGPGEPVRYVRGSK
jgi:sn-glycerol 3-phosphate transport system ATP-binding protein